MTDFTVFFPHSQAFLCPTEGEFRRYVDGAIVEELSSDHIDKTLKRLKPKDELGEEYSNVYEPAVPACELLDLCEVQESPLPISVKSAGDKEDTVPCIGSGRRSAILHHQGRTYRLKGCGDLTEGFPVIPMAFPPEGREVRGCCFHQTVLREQLMSAEIDKLLRTHGYESANKPIGYWRYTGAEASHLPLVPKYCGLFETLSEKRLGSHLLGGVDALLVQLQRAVDTAQLEARLKAKRQDTSQLVTTERLRENRGPADTDNIHEWTLQGVFKNSSLLLDVLEPGLLEAVTAETPASDVCSVLAGSDAADALRAVGQVLWTIGREVGEVKRIFQDNDVSWGYFIDHNPFEPHCNAHPNNFAVLPPGHSRLLAPLDFDMAFNFKGFVNTVEGSDLGKHDYSLMQNWMNSERIALEEALSGVENMANFSYGEEPQVLHPAVKTAFKDTLVLAYREGFERVADRHAVGDWSEVRVVVEHCLELTAGVTKY
jgi:hypothetical protein